jgi:hypothetical protein
MSLRTAEIELHVDRGVSTPAVERHLVAARKAFEEARRAIEQIAILDLGTLPTAAEKFRGRLLFKRGGTGVSDELWICHKDSTDAYIWTQIV